MDIIIYIYIFLSAILSGEYNDIDEHDRICHGASAISRRKVQSMTLNECKQ